MLPKTHIPSFDFKTVATADVSPDDVALMHELFDACYREANHEHLDKSLTVLRYVTFVHRDGEPAAFALADHLVIDLPRLPRTTLTRGGLEVLGLKDYRVRLGMGERNSEKYVGTPENWIKAEEAIRSAAVASGIAHSEEVGEAAFYGPKIDFVVKDCIGRSWQLGTVQVDYNLPERFDLSYIGSDNAPHRPVMIHRAPFGSMERFVGILNEHFAGAFPMGLSPVQVGGAEVSGKGKS